MSLWRRPHWPWKKQNLKVGSVVVIHSGGKQHLDYKTNRVKCKEVFLKLKYVSLFSCKDVCTSFEKTSLFCSSSPGVYVNDSKLFLTSISHALVIPKPNIFIPIAVMYWKPNTSVFFLSLQAARSALLSYEDVSQMLGDVRKIDFGQILSKSFFISGNVEIFHKVKTCK